MEKDLINKKTVKNNEKIELIYLQLEDYKKILETIVGKIKDAQTRAMVTVNRELISIYWEIGKTISEQQQVAEWGSSVVVQLSKDLQNSFPGMKGFSSRNLWRMRDFYISYHQNEKLTALLAEISWTHHVYILEKCKNSLEREYYIKMSKRNSWSYRVLLNQIDNQNYEKTMISQSNFDRNLPETMKPEAKLSFKDEHAFDFLELGDKHSEKEITTLIEEIRKSQKKPRKYRQSGHLVDQKLKYQTSKHPPSLFDTLMSETQQKIEESRIEVKAEGIKLSYAENKLVHALNLLLHEKSQNTNPEKDDFYSGNAPSELVPYGVPDNQEKAPVLRFRPSELYKAFMGTNEYSGADINFIISTLYQLESKKMLIKYDRIKKVKQGNKFKTLTDRIEDFQSLIKVISFIPDLSDEEKAALDKGDSSIREMKGEIIIALNPIFRDQIDTKFIEFPEDTNRRLVIAAGGHNRVTVSMQTLMEWMLREMSAKRYKAEINEDKLTYILGLEKYINQNRKKLLQERIEKDIQAIINMGIILNVEKKQNTVGGIKLIFHLNKDYD